MGLSRQKKGILMTKKRGAHVPNFSLKVAYRLFKVCMKTSRQPVSCLITFLKRVIHLKPSK